MDTKRATATGVIVTVGPPSSVGDPPVNRAAVSTRLGAGAVPVDMVAAMPELIAPTARLHTAWLEAHAEWGPGVHEDGFGLLPSDEVDAPADFAA